ncbi:MAG: hypothetical protein J6U82_05745 [Alistipes sp.]|nr:hypothetical protein [Alistipes sp.]
MIKEVRESTQALWESHQRYIETNGEAGLLCFTPDVLIQRLNRTDREIIEQGLAKGVYIEDAEDYLK